MKDFPKISALMVTRGEWKNFSNSLRCFEEQDYPNRELIIIGDSSTQNTDELLALQKERVHIYLVDGKQSLSQLRNLSVEKAKGSYVIQWDDDDLYSTDRMSRQFQCLQETNSDVNFVTLVYHYFENDRELFLEDWNQYAGVEGFFPGSLLARRETLPLYEETVNGLGEDSRLNEHLIRNPEVKVSLYSGPPVYFYSFHGENAWNELHHDHLVLDFGCSSEQLKTINGNSEKLPYFEKYFGELKLLDKFGY